MVIPRDRQYLMGDETAEQRRLRVQAAWYAEQTRSLLVQAGVARGMRVLDFGCGTGDVSRLVADLVGVEGAVLGLDRSDKMLAAADANVGHPSVAWVRGDERDVERLGPFDAVVGRLVLMHQPDPAATLTTLSRALRPNGIVFFEEPDLEEGMACWPRVPEFTRAIGWVLAALRAAGVRADLGRMLPTIFAQSGLPAPQASLRRPARDRRRLGGALSRGGGHTRVASSPRGRRRGDGARGRHRHVGAAAAGRGPHLEGALSTGAPRGRLVSGRERPQTRQYREAFMRISGAVRGTAPFDSRRAGAGPLSAFRHPFPRSDRR
jgi:SAM-dependent methyltransferase